MANTLELALLAGASYFSTRSDINRFPIPTGWSELIGNRGEDPQTGFEARAFQSGSEIVISYAGTYSKSGADLQADVNLGLGLCAECCESSGRSEKDLGRVRPTVSIMRRFHVECDA